MPNNYVSLIDVKGDVYSVKDISIHNTLGVANGIATLDETGKVPNEQLSIATQTNDGLMSKEDKELLNNIPKQIIVDNLLPYPYSETTHTQYDVTWTDNGDGTITANGTNTDTSKTSQFYFNVDTPLDLKPNTTYTLSGCSGGGATSTYRIRIIINYQKDGQVQYSDVGNGVTFTTPSNYIHCRIMIDVGSGVTVNNLIFKPMLEKGTVAHSYQPYTKSRDGIIEQIIVDNLIDSNFTEGWVRTGSYSYESGKATFKKGANASSNNSYHCKDYYLEKGKTYTVSAKVNTSFGSGGWINAMYVFDTNPATFETIAVERGNGKIETTFSVEKDCKYVRLQFSFNEGGTNGYATEGTEITFSEMMLEEGNVAHKYQPYNLSRKGIVEQIVVDNLLEFPYYEKTKTQNGITFTVNDDDGTVKVNGTASENVQFIFTHRIDNKVVLPAGTYTVSGCPKGGGSNSYYLQIAKTKDNSFYLMGVDTGNGFTFTLTEDTDILIAIYIASGVTVSNLVFKPMLERGTVAHPYQPYILSRQKLREDINNAGTGGSAVSVTQSLTTGTKVGTITVDGTVTDLYAPTNTDTKNTAGSTDSSSKLFLVGATSQAANPQTYSHNTIYAGTDGHLYSNSKQVVNLSDNQALTNKTYNGYTLGDACEKGVDTSIIPGSQNLVTGQAVMSALPKTFGMDAGTSNGLVPPSGGGTTKYLREDGTWQVPPSASGTYEIGTGTTAGITKLYSGLGSSTDGAITQQAMSSVISGLNIPSVANNLTSTSTTAALSANQGRILNNKGEHGYSLITGTLLNLQTGGTINTYNSRKISDYDFIVICGCSTLEIFEDSLTIPTAVFKTSGCSFKVRTNPTGSGVIVVSYVSDTQIDAHYTASSGSGYLQVYGFKMVDKTTV